MLLKNGLFFIAALLLGGCPSETKSEPLDGRGPAPLLPLYYLTPSDLMTSTGDTVPQLLIRGLPMELSEAARGTIEAALALVEYPSGTPVLTDIVYEGGQAVGSGDLARFTLVPKAPLTKPWYAFRFTPSAGMFSDQTGDGMGTNGRVIPGGHESRFAPGSQPLLRLVSACVKSATQKTVVVRLSERGKSATAPGDLVQVTQGGKAVACADETSIDSGTFGAIHLLCPIEDGATIRVAYSDNVKDGTGAAFRTFSGKTAVDVTLTLPPPGKGGCTSVEPT